LYFSELVDLVRNRLGLSVLLLGSAGEASLLSEIATRSGPGVYVSAGDVPLDLMPLCLGRARFFVGNDSGPLHMAVMMGTPTYSFFGSSDIRRTGPFAPGNPDHLSFTDPVPCAPCGDFKTKCSHLSCLVGVTPNVVFEKILEKNNLSITDSHRQS
jgi:ADP-heptose:LPS heptosyltransferase